jgi:hypothetical protein
MNPKHTDYDLWDHSELVDEIIRLRLRVKELETDNSNMSWQTNPDRMGGSFTQDEIDNAKAWR